MDFFFNPQGVAVCVLTGHGLKDPERAIKTCDPIVTVPATLEAVASAAGVS